MHLGGARNRLCIDTACDKQPIRGVRASQICTRGREANQEPVLHMGGAASQRLVFLERSRIYNLSVSGPFKIFYTDMS